VSMPTTRIREHDPPHHRSFNMQEGLARAETPGSRKAPSEPEAALIETDIPARLERLPWGRFHTLIVIALGEAHGVEPLSEAI
jgi:hypothetical protein